MERLSRFAHRLGWPRKSTKACEELLPPVEQEILKPQHIATRRFMDALEGVILWENAYNSIYVSVAFSVLFWIFVVLEVRGFVAASSAALVIVFCYSTLEAEEEVPNFQIWKARKDQLEKLVKKIKFIVKALVRLQQEQSKTFYSIVCTISLGLCLVFRNLDSILLTYTICMAILLGPALLIRILCEELSNDGWDREIEEFLPTVTEDNLQVLKRAGEAGERSPTPQNPNKAHGDHFDDEDLFNLKMPSHEDGSVDGAEHEFSNNETDLDGIRFQAGYFERGSSSSSDDDVDLGLEPRKFNEDDDKSTDSEFDIIDSLELSYLKSV